MFRYCSILTVFLSVLFTSEAGATGGVFCESKDGTVEIGIGMGRVLIFAPLNAQARYGEKHWSSIPQSGETELGSSQGLIEKDTLAADFADVQITKIIIRLRVDYSGEGDENGYPGTLTFEDGVVHKVNCEFE